MAPLSNVEFGKFLQVSGLGKMPAFGGPAASLKPSIAQTVPYETTSQQNTSVTSGVMELTPIMLTSGIWISNINFVSGTQAESGGTHLWFALYDDGRSSTVSGQLGLLGQTADQTGATAFGANTNLGLALSYPILTTYTGIYYVALMCAASQTPGLASMTIAGSLTTASASGSYFGGTAGTSLTTSAPDPSGAIAAVSRMNYAYVS